MAITDSTRAEIDVIDERRRQRNEEGWTEEHDDTHNAAEMARAAAFYSLHAASLLMPLDPLGERADCARTVVAAEQAWPAEWSHEWRKPKMPRRSLVVAAALLIAEIERLDRISERNKRAEWAQQTRERLSR